MPTAAPTAKRVGIIGTGFISRGVAQMIARSPDLQVSKVLTQLPQLRLKKARKSLFFNGRARKVGTTFGPFREEGGGVGGVPGRGDRAEWLGPDQDAQRTGSSVSGRR